MSQEQPPIRSRRELRKARDAQQSSVATATDELSLATGKPAPGHPAQGVPAPASEHAPAPDPTNTQRSSQIRARDRAALRTIKELEEKEGQLAAGGPPTRRQLRLQQLKEQALTAANPIVTPAPPSDTAAKGPANPGLKPKVMGGPDAPGANSAPVPISDAPHGMTVEQALAARALIAEQAKNQIAKMEHIASLDPEAVDPEILAEQIALAERAAVLNRRAIAKQKLAEQTGFPATANHPSSVSAEPAVQQQGLTVPPVPAQRPAPSTASNLAMVTPLEFVKVPGVDRPVMKPPATTHVPVTTRPGTKVPPDTTKAAGAKRRRGAAGAPPAGSGAGPGRSQVIARAEAAARAAARPKPAVLPPAVGAEAHGGAEDLPRVPARSAHGLDPLDVATAGLARATRNRILQFCVLAFGFLALVSGIILIISGMSR